jgi:hypothetical protein
LANSQKKSQKGVHFMTENSLKVLTTKEKNHIKDNLFSKTAKRMFSRLQLGRINAERLIEIKKEELVNNLPYNTRKLLLSKKVTHKEKAIILKPIIEESIDNIFQIAYIKPFRKLQYIINKNGVIVNVATEKHQILDTKEVGKTVIEVFEENGYTIVDTWKNYRGITATNKMLQTPFGRMKAGLGVSFGSITLTRAIKCAIFFQIEVCTNPLSFLELHNTMGTKLSLTQNKVLRIGNSRNILDRTKIAVKSAIDDWKIDKIPSQIINNGKRELALEDANAIVKAMSNAYSVGSRIQDEIIESYATTKNTIWELAMIISKISADADKFNKNVRLTHAKLSAIGLVLLTTTEINRCIINSRDYCLDHNIKI